MGASSNPYRVDGVSRTVWLLSREQAKLGNDVSLLLDTPPDPDAVQIARDAGLKLIHIDSGLWAYPRKMRDLLDRDPPQIVHMHSVFVVKQSALGLVLNEYGIPYIITPHGGLAPQVLRRGALKKAVYILLRERPRFMGSSALALVTPAEERAVRSFIPSYSKPMRWMPNPVEIEKLEPHPWQGVRQPRRLVYLGRFDVLVKGIDILIEIARLLPDVAVDLYGTEDPKTLNWLNRLKQNLPPNVTFHNPIFGSEKAAMLSQASLYIQPSRWEGFPVSVAECMHLGVPAAIADTLDLAQLFYQHGLGLVLPLDAVRAAATIRAALDDEPRLNDWSQRGRRFAREHFHPTAVASNHLKLYQEVVDAKARARARDAGELSYSAVASKGVSRNGHSRRARSRLVPPHVRGVLKSNVSRIFERSGQLLGTNGLPRTLVLCYHSIAQGHADLSVDPNSFRIQLATLKELGFEFLSFADLVYRLMRWGPPKNNVACITFDDGYEDNLTQAAPILLDLAVPATMFITSGLMAREPAIIEHFHSLTHFQSSYLSGQQVTALNRMGFEIGAHSHSHVNLARLSQERVRYEVTRSKQMLEDTIGRQVRSFAYPFGKKGIHYSPATVAVVRESGYCGAAAVAFRSVTANKSIRIYEVPRFFINRSDTPASFRQKVAGHFDWLGSIQEGAPAWVKAMVSPEERY